MSPLLLRLRFYAPCSLIFCCSRIFTNDFCLTLDFIVPASPDDHRIAILRNLLHSRRLGHVFLDHDTSFLDDGCYLLCHTMASTSSASNAIVHDRKYYADEMRCFVSSCKKYRRDNPNLTYLRIPQPLKEVWCTALERNCPKMPLYVCDEHINIDEDCYRNKSGKLRLKCTANLILTRTYYETEMEIEAPEEIMEIVPDQKCDASTQCQIERKHKAVLEKPAVRSFGCTANIKQASSTGMLMLSQQQQQQQQQLSSPTASGTSTATMFEVSSPLHSTTSSNEENVVNKDLSGRNHMLRLIEEKPKKYIGVPKAYYWLVKFLAVKCALPELHVIITLFKIKYNDDIERICDHFNFSEVTVIELLKVCMPQLATYLQSFIYLPEAIVIKKTLPPVFKARYANIKCIIDCFEIEVEKASDTVTQSGTWSQYKSGNTAKYLIACCPNGFICFISKGYGGRTSDKAITESCGFADILPPGAVVLADRGFKGIETHLRERHVQLLRPPSVSSKETPSKKEVLLGKVIASLRIHVERLIRRVREFRFLKPHSVTNHSHMRYLDNSVIIACALVNLQDNLIKLE